MDFFDLQQAVLLERFGESKRDDAKRQINSRYARIWLAENWSFRYALISVPVSIGANSFDRGIIQTPIAIWDSTLNENWADVHNFRPEEFLGRQYTGGGSPYKFTVIGSTVMLDRPMTTNTTLQVYGETEWTPLVNDADEPLLPEGFHVMIAMGAASDLLKWENDPSYKPMEDSYKEYMEDMKKGYIGNNYAYSVWPSWP